MMQNRLLGSIRSLVDIRPGEWLMTSLMSFNLFLVISTFAVVKPVRSSLFLQVYGAENLPYMYIATALLAGLIALLEGWLFSRFSTLRVQVLIYLFFISNLLLFWWAFQRQSPWLPAAFFLWTNVFTVTVNTLFWILANNFYNPREAKRLYGVINSGGTIGGIVSGFALAQVVTGIGTENLLLLCAALLTLGLLVSYLIYRRGQERLDAQALGYAEVDGTAPTATKEKRGQQRKSLLVSPYSRYIAAALGLALIISIIVDFQFNVVIERTFASKDAKTAFFSSFFAWVNVLTFVLQFFLTGALLRRLGIGAALLILPVTMLVGSALFPFYPVLATAIFLRISDSSVRYSIEQSTRDVLYLPIPKLQMKRLKAFVDVFIQRVAKGVGSLLILFLTAEAVVRFRAFGVEVLWPGLALGFETLSYITLAVAGVWAVVAVILRKEYVNELRRFLGREDLRDEERVIRYLDQATTAELLRMLESSDEGKAIYALEMLERAQILDLRLVLRQWAREGSPVLKAHAFHRLAEIGDPAVISDAETILTQEPSEVTGEAIHYLCETASEGPKVKMQELLALPDPRVRAAALACMVNHGGPDNIGRVRDMLLRMIRRAGLEGLDSRILAARTLGHIHPPSTLHALLAPLLQDESDDVVRTALQSAREVRRLDLVPPIVHLLGHSAISEEAFQALVTHGEGILGTLADFMDDQSLSAETRCRLPAIFAEIASPRGARHLVSALAQDERPFRHAVIKALARLRSLLPDLQIRDEQILKALSREVEEAHKSLRARHGTNQTGSPAEGEGRTHQYQQSLRMIFRLLSLVYTPRDIANAYRGLNSTRSEVRAGAIEFLDNVLPAGLRRRLLPLVDVTVPPAEKLEGDRFPA